MKVLLREALLYIAASGLGLATDLLLLWLFVEMAQVHYLLAASIAFAAGTAIVYTLSVTVIFRHRRMDDRRLELGTFASIGGIGLLVNFAVLKLSVEVFGAHYLVGKLVSVVFTFSLNFGLRRYLLFTPRGAATRVTARRGPIV